MPKASYRESPKCASTVPEQVHSDLARDSYKVF
jgi:hypothetical protein